MNCVNHPEEPVSAYCQNCGKGLCSSCVRSVAGVIYCEPCLAARLGIGGAAAAGAPPRGVAGPGMAGSGAPGPGMPDPWGPNPATAFILGFIPGVGAMYNGQFIKGLVHVVVFIILIGITEHVGIFGIFIAAWIAYQVFDAFETAKARREGRPLPDPFGLNDFGAKMGIPGPGFGAPGANPNAGPGAGQDSGQGFASGQVPPAPPPPPAAGYADPYSTGGGPWQHPGWTDPYYSGGAPYPGYAPPPHPCGWRRREPVGAIILIVLGVLFLLSTMNVFDFDWFGRLWPVLIIGFGVAIFLRRSRQVPPPPPVPPPSQPPPPPSSSGGGQ